jgi:hypothetical protein
MTDENAEQVIAEDEQQFLLRGAAPRENESTDEPDEDEEPDEDDDADGDDDSDEEPDEDDDSDDDDDEDDDDETDEVKSLKADLATAEQRITSLRAKVKARGAEIAALREKVAQGKPAAAKPKAKESSTDDSSTDDGSAARIAELEKNLADQRVRSAFDSDSTYAWNDPDLVFGLIDLDDVRDSDGKIDRSALTDALKDLAKERPYLVKTTTAKRTPPKPGRPTGVQPGAHKRDRSKQSDDKAIKAKYPAVARRV